VLRPLAIYATQRIVLAPTARVRSDTSAQVRALGSTRMIGMLLDGSVIGQLRERGLADRWVLPADLMRSYERNRTYAPDPYQLAIEPLRPATFVAGSKFGEPLSSQLRTMIALHEDARIVLLPIELHFEGTRAVLRAALLDPRSAEARWVGVIKSDSSANTAAFALTQVAHRLVNLFVTP
jgi:hypothetical protein